MVTFKNAGSLIDSKHAELFMGTYPVQVINVDETVRVTDTFTINRDYYQDHLTVNIEYEGRNWKTKTYTDTFGVVYITLGPTENVVGTTTMEVLYEGTQPPDGCLFMVAEKLGDEFEICGGKVYGYKLSWYSPYRDGSKKIRNCVHTIRKPVIEFSRNEDRQISTTSRTQYLYGTTGRNRVRGLLNQSIQPTYERIVKDLTLFENEYYDELKGAREMAQKFALQNLIDKETPKSTKLSPWQKFVNTVGGAFDSYHSVSGSTIGIGAQVSGSSIVLGFLGANGSANAEAYSKALENLRVTLGSLQPSKGVSEVPSGSGDNADASVFGGRWDGVGSPDYTIAQSYDRKGSTIYKGYGNEVFMKTYTSAEEAVQLLENYHAKIGTKFTWAFR